MIINRIVCLFIMSGIALCTSWNRTDLFGAHNYPNVLNLHWLNGADIVNLTCTCPKVVQAGSSVVCPNATIVRTPEYLRSSNGNGTLKI
jgi:hypothetical protein